MVKGKFRNLFRKLVTPVTIMLIPHNSRSTFRIKMPSVALFAIALLSLIGTGYLYKLVGDAIKYAPTKEKLDYYQGQFIELESTIASLRMANNEFRKLFSLENKEDVLENMNTSDVGAIDMTILRKQINKTIDTVGEIRDYMSEQRDLYMATPMGWPAKGWLTSGFGYRLHPIRATRDFHTGLDIASRPGTLVRATADGIVSFAGRSGANGNLVALEHGFGYTTYYAHNKKLKVEVRDVVKRGDIIAYVGSTGSSTGPHLHYEIWKNGKNVNPKPYLKGGRW
jgi:murein DD-endopeptidase MepM/ murein hydrolase activator NlpD